MASTDTSNFVQLKEKLTKVHDSSISNGFNQIAHRQEDIEQVMASILARLSTIEKAMQILSESTAKGKHAKAEASANGTDKGSQGASNKSDASASKAEKAATKRAKNRQLYFVDMCLEDAALFDKFLNEDVEVKKVVNTTAKPAKLKAEEVPKWTAKTLYTTLKSFKDAGKSAALDQYEPLYLAYKKEFESGEPAKVQCEVEAATP